MVGRRVEVRVSQREVTAVALGTGELAGKHRRVFAAGQQITDPAHQQALERLRLERYAGKPPVGEDVEVRELAVFDRVAEAAWMGQLAELARLFRALKMPAAARTLPKLADRARAEEWSYERFVQSLLETEVSARDSHGGGARIGQARFPARKTLEEFDFSFQRSVRRR